MGEKKKILKDVVRKYKNFFEEEKHRKEELGEVRPIIHIDYNGYKIVAVGTTIYYSKEWKTFIDFLFAYIRKILGEEWGNSEIRKPEGEKHPIIKWYQRVCSIQKEHKQNQNGIHSMIANGTVAGYINLSYDLYILGDNLRLQSQIIKRIKDPNQFQGARYELYVAATCIRAGFDTDYEDETHRSDKHPEFIARHRSTGIKLAVEAKSRHRAGVLGQPGQFNEQEVKIDVGRLLSKAIGKNPSFPYVIFIDLNLPPLLEDHIPKKLHTLGRTADRISKNFGAPPDPFNLILFTNNPHHFGDDRLPDPKKNVISVLSKKPKYSISDRNLLNQLVRATLQYGNVPSLFPD